MVANRNLIENGFVPALLNTAGASVRTPLLLNADTAVPLPRLAAATNALESLGTLPAGISSAAEGFDLTPFTTALGFDTGLSLGAVDGALSASPISLIGLSSQALAYNRQLKQQRLDAVQASSNQLTDVSGNPEDGDAETARPAEQVADETVASRLSGSFQAVSSSLRSITSGLAMEQDALSVFDSLAYLMNMQAFDSYQQANDALEESTRASNALNTKLQTLMFQARDARSAGNDFLASNLSNRQMSETQQTRSELSTYSSSRMEADEQRRTAETLRDEALDRRYWAEINSINLTYKFLELSRIQQSIAANQLGLA